MAWNEFYVKRTKGTGQVQKGKNKLFTTKKVQYTTENNSRRGIYCVSPLKTPLRQTADCTRQGQ